MATAGVRSAYLKDNFSEDTKKPINKADLYAPSRQPLGAAKLDTSSLDDRIANQKKELDLYKRESDLQATERKNQPIGQFIGGASAGISAGLDVQPTTSTAESVLGAAGAVASGAAAGYMVGGPYGAGVGAVAGLVSGGIKAFIGNQAANREADRRAKEAKIANKYIMAQNKEEQRQRRFYENMTQKQFKLDKKASRLNEKRFMAGEEQRELQNKWQRIKQQKTNFDYLLGQNERLRNLFVQRNK